MPPVAVHSPRAAPAGEAAPWTDHVSPDTLMTTAVDQRMLIPTC